MAGAAMEHQISEILRSNLDIQDLVRQADR